MRLAFIGGGFMGEAMISAVLRGNVAAPDALSVGEVSEERRRHLQSRYGVGVSADNAEAARGADIVVLAVKPQEFAAVARGLRDHLGSEQTVASIMAGVRIDAIREALGHRALVRVMPNTAALVGEAMSLWTATEEVDTDRREQVRRILAAMGKEMYVTDEKYLDIATAVSGSGPGFVFLLLEAFIDGAVHIGLRREAATETVLQTVLGSVRMAQETGKHPAELRNMVTSPGGTTAEGLRVLEEAGVRRQWSMPLSPPTSEPWNWEDRLSSTSSFAS
ncbi:MAG: pyrroline-5-carboxylate reductase [Candidatus Bathyarchaeota archaeon]|nr:pyrroline-5-carboxylate reductase [Candidatus Bathyarchaeota archaeon]